MICRGFCACTETLWMCVLYVSFGSKVRPRTFGCLPWVVFCFVQAKTSCGYGCMYLLAAPMLVCVDVSVMSSAYAMT